MELSDFCFYGRPKNVLVLPTDRVRDAAPRPVVDALNAAGRWIKAEFSSEFCGAAVGIDDCFVWVWFLHGADITHHV